MRSEAYVGLGANLGDCAANLRAALDMMRPFAEGMRASPLYRTSPVGFRAQPAFYNAACRFWTRLSPYELMERLLAIEDAVGRHRAFRNAPRALDLDILMYGELRVNAPPLTLPHPRMRERRFVLLPLADVAPHGPHPSGAAAVREALRRLPRQRSERIERMETTAWLAQG